MNFHIRNEQSDDLDAITRVTEQAFLNAPHTSHTEQHIVNALRQRGKLTISLVAEAQGELIGHIAISPVAIQGHHSSGQTDAANTQNWYGLGPVSVHPDRQGQGVGSALIREALNRLQAHNAAGCVLLGDPGYYNCFGFKPHPGLELPGVPPEYFMALGFGGEIPVGVVKYDDAFELDTKGSD
ncbi:GNAT family N-acetyltransferase [Hahella sp. KA22]|uniref:GNAT family N-acetyltransferase n=1 Tax=Hahella sp. KA22 TaxID=1628392 RepID=UPI000FDDE309|nr:N-acetyltransferase [Hahella sp. KA22]AZZ92180.1 N-acetyltransferase [Hahella sp. KA22]QAY55551.1 GNAT family N-acetyltransferase [Hahella sp. KA22]